MQVALVIEDDPETLIAWAFVLRSFGFTVLEAVSRGEAWRVCHEHQGTIHLVVTKAILGNHRTSDFIARLRLVYPQIRALFVSDEPSSEQIGVAAFSQENLAFRDVGYPNCP